MTVAKVTSEVSFEQKEGLNQTNQEKQRKE